MPPAAAAAPTALVPPAPESRRPLPSAKLVASAPATRGWASPTRAAPPTPDGPARRSSGRRAAPRASPPGDWWWWWWRWRVGVGGRGGALVWKTFFCSAGIIFTSSSSFSETLEHVRRHHHAAAARRERRRLAPSMAADPPAEPERPAAGARDFDAYLAAAEAETLAPVFERACRAGAQRGEKEEEEAVRVIARCSSVT